MHRCVGKVAIGQIAASMVLAVAATGCVTRFDDVLQVAQVGGVPDGIDVSTLPSASSGNLKAPDARPAGETARSWTAGHAMVGSGGKLFIADRERDAVVVMRQQPLEVVQTLSVANRPEKLVVGPDGAVWVVPRMGTTVLRFAATGNPEQPLSVQSDTLEVGLEPRALALSTKGHHLYVALGGLRQLVTFDAVTRKELYRQTLAASPTALAVAPSYLAVTYDDGNIERFLLSDNKAPATMGSSPAATGASLVSTCKDPLRKSRRILGAAYEPATDEVLVARVVAAPGSPKDLMTPNKGGKGGGGDGYGSSGGNTDCVEPRRPIEASVLATSNTAKVSRELTGKPLRLAASGDSAANSQEPPVGPQAFATRFDQPADVVAHPSRRLVAVPATGTDNVLLLHSGGKLAADQAVEAGELVSGQAPTAVAFSDDGRFAFVLDSHEVKVSAFDLGPWLNSDAAIASLPTFQPVVRVAFGIDTLPEAARLGRRTFTFAGNARLSKGGTFACATCHFDGGEDKLAWVTPEGVRQTPQLAGRLDGTAPFNWKGTEDDLKNNMVKTVERMHGQGLTVAELASLEQFLLVGLAPAAPNPYVAANGALTAKQAHGKELFEGVAGCAACHLGGTGVDGVSHDVGTGTPIDQQAAMMNGDFKPGAASKFDTPTLRGLWNTAPYLHDGSAATLTTLLDRLGNSMGHAAKLSSVEKADLIEYLKTL